MFLAMTADCTAGAARDAGARASRSTRSSCCSHRVFVGTYVLEFFGLSVPIVQVAGGMVVCALGWDLLRQESTRIKPGARVRAEPTSRSARSIR